MEPELKHGIITATGSDPLSEIASLRCFEVGTELVNANPVRFSWTIFGYSSNSSVWATYAQFNHRGSFSVIESTGFVGPHLWFENHEASREQVAFNGIWERGFARCCPNSFDHAARPGAATICGTKIEEVWMAVAQKPFERAMPLDIG
jgi:hypothetical protein